MIEIEVDSEWNVRPGTKVRIAVMIDEKVCRQDAEVDEVRINRVDGKGDRPSYLKQILTCKRRGSPESDLG